MAAERRSSLERQVRVLWAVGTVGDLDDASLLARFALRLGDSAREAFRVLVERHGPMVLRICQQVLGDRHDAEDAAQAVFLVLARKAAGLRINNSLAPWLHGVSRRVAAKARVRTLARRQAEMRTAIVAASVRASEGDYKPSGDDWEAVHEEVERLPEKYRAPVVLCYLDGQTYEETARRIGCPVGTVRVRLSRARDRLRDRLTRRGFGPEHVVLPELTAACPDERRTGAKEPVAPSMPLCGAAWLEATVKSAEAVSLGRAAMSGTVSASVQFLYEGMIKAMLMNRGKMVAIWLLGSGVTVAGAIALAAGAPGTQDKGVSPAGSSGGAMVRKEKTGPPQLDLDSPDALRKANERRLEAAQQRLAAQRDYYEQGRITIDRFNEASRQIMLAKMAVSTTKEQRVAAAKAHWELMTEVLGRERAELTVGRGTVADVSEALVAEATAEVGYLEARQSRGPEEVEVLKKRVETLQKQVAGLTQRLEKFERSRNSAGQSNEKDTR
jgi:RNA polymerase sigma factor (sigma-70 family)